MNAPDHSVAEIREAFMMITASVDQTLVVPFRDVTKLLNLATQIIQDALPASTAE